MNFKVKRKESAEPEWKESMCFQDYMINFSSQQIAILNQIFLENPTVPSKQELKKMSEAWKIPQTKLKKWFEQKKQSMHEQQDSMLFEQAIKDWVLNKNASTADIDIALPEPNIEALFNSNDVMMSCMEEKEEQDKIRMHEIEIKSLISQSRNYIKQANKEIKECNAILERKFK